MQKHPEISSLLQIPYAANITSRLRTPVFVCRIEKNPRLIWIVPFHSKNLSLLHSHHLYPSDPPPADSLHHFVVWAFTERHSPSSSANYYISCLQQKQRRDSLGEKGIKTQLGGSSCKHSHAE